MRKSAMAECVVLVDELDCDDGFGGVEGDGFADTVKLRSISFT